MDAFVLGKFSMFCIPNWLSLDKRQPSIFVVSSSYQVTRSIGREGKKSGCLNSPTALLLDNKGRLIVSDNGNDRIQVN